MKRNGLIFLLAVSVGFFSGCQKPEATAAPPQPRPASLEDLLPKGAQPKLATMRVYLGAEMLDAELALSQREQMTGMMFRTNIQDADAMLFVLPYTQRANFWMKNCPESISAAYVDVEGVIREIHHLEKNDTNGVFSAEENIRFVLETSDGWFARHHIETNTVIRTDRGSLGATFLRQ